MHMYTLYTHIFPVECTGVPPFNFFFKPEHASLFLQKVEPVDEGGLVLAAVGSSNYQQSINPPTSLSSKPRGRKRPQSEAEKKKEDVPIKKAVKFADEVYEERAEKDSNRFDIFAKYVASELKEIGNPDMQRWAKQQITSILYRAQSGSISPSNSLNLCEPGLQPAQLVLIRSTDSTDTSKSDTSQSLLDSLNNN